MKDMDGEEERTAGRKRRAPKGMGTCCRSRQKPPSTSRRKRDAHAPPHWCFPPSSRHLALQHCEADGAS
ncbi:hypothetical protein BDA96_01G121600 [Sorghum bicolor]|uniref:Uncharacterized protein n=2 Tax=Sorghum bicolor TaxID=4558 RepID=A0A921UYB9_SORBI|nr:hypothetical protein BDA96_01G121600 [Sorghum bicolor]OQU91110.1 hypothetical protein SORBI_3001G116650 [Sorghum bicolor]